MATAAKIEEISSSYCVQSGSVTAPVLKEVVREAGPTRSTKGLLTKQAPLLTTPAPSTGGGSQMGYLQALFEYMTGLLDSGIQLAQDQTKVGQTETTAANASTKMAQAKADEIKKEWEEYYAALEKAKHASFWTKIGMSIAGALMTAIGCLAMNPQIALMGAMTIAMANGGSEVMDKLFKLNSLPLGLKILAEVGIAVVLAAVTCGVSGVGSALSAGAGTAATEATEAATNAAAEAVAASAEESAEAGASAAARAGGAAAENQSFASKVFEEGFMAGRFRGANFIANASAMSLFANPFTDITVAGIRGLRKAGAHISDSDEAIASQVVGMIVGLVLAMGTSLCSSAGSQLGGTKLSQYVGEKAVSNALSFFRLMTGLTMAGTGVAGVVGGKATLDQASALDQLGKAQKDLSVYRGEQSILSQAISSTQTTTKIVGDAYADINNRWGSFVASYAMAAEILG